jgi:hypothetical protein
MRASLASAILGDPSRPNVHDRVWGIDLFKVGSEIAVLKETTFLYLSCSPFIIIVCLLDHLRSKPDNISSGMASGAESPQVDYGLS